MNYVESFNLLGVAVMQIPCVKRKGAPTTATKGAVGLLYMNTDNGDMYKCIAVTGNTYTWVALVEMPKNIVQSVNGIAPDENGNVDIGKPESGGGDVKVLRIVFNEDDGVKSYNMTPTEVAHAIAGGAIVMYHIRDENNSNFECGVCSMTNYWDCETYESVGITTGNHVVKSEIDDIWVLSGFEGEGEGEDGLLLSVTIRDESEEGEYSTDYQIPSGMTWREWCASNYNTDGYRIEEDCVLVGEGLCLMDSDWNPVSADDVIFEGTYVLSP